MNKAAQINELIVKYQTIFQKYFHALNNLAEPSLAEFKTTNYLVSQLEDLGIKFTKLSVNTGLFGELNFQKPHTIAFRADLDALPIGEEKFAHRCGHSSHSASLLALLYIIKKENLQVPFNVRFIFQPAEENGKGAPITLAEKAYDNIDFAFASHSYITPKDEVIVGHGEMLSGAGGCEITVKGPGGHSSLSNDIPNPLVALIDILHLINVELKTQDLKSDFASFCVAKLTSGEQHNIIPHQAQALITFRYYKERNQEFFTNLINKYCHVDNAQLTIDVKHNDLNPGIINDEKALEVLKKALANSGLITNELTDFHATFSEDFALVLTKHPGAQIMVGIKDQEDLVGLHKPEYRPEKGHPISLLKLWLAFILTDIFM